MKGIEPKTRPQGRVFAFHSTAGFTLVELVVILLLMGILAAAAMPRFFGANQFHEMGYADVLSSAVRFAQKTAVATGCETRAQVTSVGYALWQRANSCHSGAFTRALQRSGGSSWQGTAPGSVSSSTLDIYFDALGVPYQHSSGSVLTASVNITVGSRSITVEPQTGYVH